MLAFKDLVVRGECEHIVQALADAGCPEHGAAAALEVDTRSPVAGKGRSEIPMQPEVADRQAFRP